MLLHPNEETAVKNMGLSVIPARFMMIKMLTSDLN